MKKLKFKTVREAYEHIHDKHKQKLKKEGCSEDKASRMANIEAIKTAWLVFNEYKSEEKV